MTISRVSLENLILIAPGSDKLNFLVDMKFTHLHALINEHHLSEYIDTETNFVSHQCGHENIMCLNLAAQ